MSKGFAVTTRSPLVVLDSNVWRFVHDCRGTQELIKTANRLRIRIGIAPAVVYEALRTPDKTLRNGLVSLMTHPKWSRLMPEAFDEAEELRYEIRRVASHWLKVTPNLAGYRRLVHDWQRPSGGFWGRARIETDCLARYLASVERSTLDKARINVKNHRKLCLDSSATLEDVNLQNSFVMVPAQNGEGCVPVEAWRASSFAYFTKALSRKQAAHAEWLSMYVDIDKMLADPMWREFWINHAKAANLQRAWLRWAMELLTPHAKVNNGTPCDVQLATYCASSDFFITADKRFCSFLEKCKRSASFRIATSAHISPKGDPFASLISTLTALAQDAVASPAFSAAQ